MSVVIVNTDSHKSNSSSVAFWNSFLSVLVFLNSSYDMIGEEREGVNGVLIS